MGKRAVKWKYIVHLQLERTHIPFEYMAHFHQFTPKELYDIVAKGASPTVENPVTNALETCPQFLLLLGKSLYQKGMRTTRVHAQSVGLPVAEMRQAMMPLTGMMYTEFTETFIELLIEELAGHDLPWGEVEKKAGRFGFSPSGLYRFMMRRMERTPSGRTWR